MQPPRLLRYRQRLRAELLDRGAARSMLSQSREVTGEYAADTTLLVV